MPVVDDDAAVPDIADAEAVDRFLAKRAEHFSGYQRVPLPHGREIPGTERSFDPALARLEPGQSLLDVGAYYGAYSLEAVRRGASRVVAVEPNKARARIATGVARLHGDAFEVRRCLLEDLDDDEGFDVVLMLNVLQHAADPVALMRKLRAVTRQLAVVKFRTHLDSRFLDAAPGERATRRSELDAVSDLGIVGVVGRGTPRMFFSPPAFRYWFVDQLGLFSEVELVDSGHDSGTRQLAYCRV